MIVTQIVGYGFTGFLVFLAASGIVLISVGKYDDDKNMRGIILGAVLVILCFAFGIAAATETLAGYCYAR